MRFEKSADTKILESVLRESKVGDTITYEALSKAVGRDVRKHCLPALNSARRRLIAESFVFDCEENVGLVRLNDSQIVKTCESDRKKIYRISNRTLKKLSVVQFDQLSAEDKREHLSHSAQAGVLAMLSNFNSGKKIAERVGVSNTKLAIGETLRMFVD